LSAAADTNFTSMLKVLKWVVGDMFSSGALAGLGGDTENDSIGVRARTNLGFLEKVFRFF